MTAGRRGAALMLQGTGSDVGKSVLVAALCRSARRRGLRVAPFKPQNMSNNAAACPGGGEIGRAQALQAMAAGEAIQVDFNPVLLKPQSDRLAQVVVHGRAVATVEAREYFASPHRLLDAVMESFGRLQSAYDLVIVEGAGSPAEINLRARDIANMGFARHADVPVCLVGDIDKGGVIASLVGTQAVLDPDDAAMIRGFLVNKFRGDPTLFTDGVTAIEERTGWPCFGVVPWLHALQRLPSEDGVALESPEPPVRQGEGTDVALQPLRIAAPMLSRMANFDDADPLRVEPGVAFEWVKPGQPIPRDADAVILFGTKSTVGDLEFMRAQGWDVDLMAHARTGGRVLGICGGYQLLGKRIHDPDGVDGEPGTVEGLGLLDVETRMRADKEVAQVVGRCAASAAAVAGYEIHVGETTGPDTVRPMFYLEETADGRPARHDGARSAGGRIEGGYVHGAFTSDGFRAEWLRRAGGSPDPSLHHGASVEAALDELCDGFEEAVNVEQLLALARPQP
ncbi:MAG: cobyric acid synthase [Planctomycetota bacterium]